MEEIIIILSGSILFIYRDDLSTSTVDQNCYSYDYRSNFSSDDNKDYSDECKNIYKNNEDILILVNGDNALPDGYSPNLMYTESKKEQVAVILYDDLVMMLRDAKNSGYTYWIASGYRNEAEQQQLVDDHINDYIRQGISFKEAEDKTYRVLEKSGHSEHHTGLAIDFLSSDNLNMDESQESCKGNIWMRENCYKYGFILRYPKGKENITNINYEPWHFRYVGREAAEFMYKNDLSLEEFYLYL